MTRYLFIDRDGTLIFEPPDQQIDSVEKFHLVDGCVRALQDLASAGFRLVMVSNQDGLGTAANPQKSFDTIQRLLLGIFSSQGVNWDNVLICPHLPAEGCACRKPKNGLVRDYLSSNEMDRTRSFVIGDRDTDLELAQNMGLRGFRIDAACGWPQIANEILRAPRVASVCRKTNETEIRLRVSLDGIGQSHIHSGLPFFDHMLEQISTHGGFDLDLEAKGDLHVDDHHLVEDVGLALGAALKEAVGGKQGIERYGFYLPMDEAACRVALDFSGRPLFSCEVIFPRESVGGIATEMFPHFFRSLADSAAIGLRIEAKGDNSHHIVESMFKGVGRSLRAALKRSEGAAIPSTKGIL